MKIKLYIILTIDTEDNMTESGSMIYGKVDDRVLRIPQNNGHM